MNSGPRIALVEDSQADQYLFSKLLGQALPQARVDIFSSVAAFRAALRPGAFDCVVLDHRLPDGSGLDLLQDLRGDEAFETLPAIVLTGWGDESTAVKAMKRGASDYLPKSSIDEETLKAALSGAFSAADRARHKRENETRLQQQALTDALTGVFNRRAFDDAVSKLDHGAERPALALVYLDLDSFKAVNDELGHAAGDEVLRAMAERLRDVVRGSDSVYRLGGDEFAIILSPPPRGDDLHTIADRIEAALHQAVHAADGSTIFSGGGSMGLVWREDAGPPMAALLQRADQAMYVAKQRGGGCELVGVLNV